MSQCINNMFSPNYFCVPMQDNYISFLINYIYLPHIIIILSPNYITSQSSIIMLSSIYTFKSQCSIFMFSQHIAVTLITNCCLLHHSSLYVYCSELSVCAVWLIVTAVQHIVDSCNVVNWILKNVFHLACHRQVEQLAAVINCRTFALEKLRCDVAVNIVCLLSLCNQSTLPAHTIYRCRWMVNYTFVSLNFV
jgi:hypothetical protein